MARNTSKNTQRGRSSMQEDFALDNNLYGVIAVLHKKSQALAAYEQYIEDADEDLQEIFEQIRNDDQRHIQELEQFLRQQFGGGAEEEEEAA